jgi:hypothetical protein
MLKNKAVPYCTCNQCEGTKTHPGDTIDGSFGKDAEHHSPLKRSPDYLFLSHESPAKNLKKEIETSLIHKEKPESINLHQ